MYGGPVSVFGSSRHSVAYPHVDSSGDRFYTTPGARFVASSSICLRICFHFPLLVSNGMYHCRKWTYLCFNFSRGLSQMEVMSGDSLNAMSRQDLEAEPLCELDGPREEAANWSEGRGQCDGIWRTPAHRPVSSLYPGEHQNRWYMGVHPPQNGRNA